MLGARAQRTGMLSAALSFSSPRTIRNYVSSVVSGNNLPVLRFDMKFKHFQKIEEKRQDALNRGILLTSDEDMVPAELTVGDRARLAQSLGLGGAHGVFSRSGWSLNFAMHQSARKPSFRPIFLPSS